MSARPTLSEIKTHSRIDNDIEDQYITQLDNSAYDFIKSFINRDIVFSSDDLTDNAILYNDQMRICELMIVDSWYNNRSSDNIPKAAEFILSQFRIVNV